MHKIQMVAMEEDNMDGKGNKTEHMAQAIITTTIIKVNTIIVLFLDIAGTTKQSKWGSE